MKLQGKTVLTGNGATITVTLKTSDIGWELRAWRHRIGDIKTVAEGDPYLHEMFTDPEAAAAAFAATCNSAVDNPDPKTVVVGPMVDVAAQVRIDDASRLEHSERERERLDGIFAQLHQETR